MGVNLDFSELLGLVPFRLSEASVFILQVQNILFIYKVRVIGNKNSITL